LAQRPGTPLRQDAKGDGHARSQGRALVEPLVGLDGGPARADRGVLADASLITLGGA